MRYGRSQLDMSHSLASDGGLGDFDAASVADDAFISDLFVLSAVALPVLCGAEDLFTEQAVLFGLQGSVVNSLGLCYLTKGPFSDLLRRSKSDLDGVKSNRLITRMFCIWHFYLISLRMSCALPELLTVKSVY